MRTVILAGIVIYEMFAIMWLKSDVKDLSKKLQKLKDDCRTLITSGAVVEPAKQTWHESDKQIITTPQEMELDLPSVHASGEVRDEYAAYLLSQAWKNPWYSPMEHTTHDWDLTNSSIENIPEQTEQFVEEEALEPKLSVQYTKQFQATKIADTGPSYMDVFMDWFKIDWPMKVGGLIFILGIGWFLIYAIQNNWISESMRIAFTMMTSFAMIWFGRYKIQSQPVQWSYLIWLWSAVYVLSIYIGFKFFAFFGTTLWLWLIAVQYALMVYLSYRYKNHWLNDVALFFSAICPFLFSDGSWNLVWLISYLIVHLVGNSIVSYHYNWAKSRLLGIFYLIVYILAGFVSSATIMWWGAIVTMITVAIMCMTFLEVWIGRTRESGFSFTQLASISVAGLTLFSYLTLLVSSNGTIVSPMVYTSILLYFALGYGVLRYMYSVSHKQNAYSSVVGILSLLFISWIAYHQLSGIWLMLASIIICGAIQALIALVTRDNETVYTANLWWLIPWFLALYNFDPEWVSTWYLVAIYTWSVIAGLLAWLYRSYLKNMSLLKIFVTGAIILFYIAICNSFDGYTRIIVLEWISIVLACIGFMINYSKEAYLRWGLITVLLSFWYILLYGIWNDVTIFALMMWLVGIIALYTTLSYKLETSNQANETLTQNILIGVGWFMLYLGICTTFEGSLRIIILEWVSIIIALVGSMLHLSRAHYIQIWLASAVLPFMYILSWGIRHDMQAFGLILWLILAMWCYMLLAHRSTADDKGTTSLDYAMPIFAGFLLYLGVCATFEWNVRIIILEWIALAAALVGSIIHLHKSQYLTLWLISTTIAFLFLIAQWIFRDIGLFWLVLWLIAILACYLVLSHKLRSNDTATEDTFSWILTTWAIVLTYLSVPYIISSDYYTLSYTIISMMIYFVWSRIWNPYQSNKLYYSWLIMIPMIASVWLLDNNNTFVVTLSSLLLSISILWLKFDNEDHELMGTGWYLYYALGLVYFWMFGYSGVSDISDASTAIVVMLIVFTMIGIGFYIYGKLHNNKQYSHIGTAIIIGIIARVLIVELRQMALIMRIVTCLVIWGMLVASGFIGNTKKEIEKLGE